MFAQGQRYGIVKGGEMPHFQFTAADDCAAWARFERIRGGANAHYSRNPRKWKLIRRTGPAPEDWVRIDGRKISRTKG